MFKAISSAFMVLLIILIVKAILPEIGDLLTEIIVKILNLVNNGLDSANNQFY